MRRSLAALCLAVACARPSGPAKDELARWEATASRVTITRDDWGIPHVKGKTDADAVFGAIYAQAEDDFNRVETNYLVAMGRLAEAEGEKELWRDLRARLYVDSLDLQARYAQSPDWLKQLMDSWADGLNYYLYTHPDTKPKVLAHFAPWMALSFSEGSIGGDIEDIKLDRLKAFYDTPATSARDGGDVQHVAATAGSADDDHFAPRGGELGGSNGMAIAPSHTKNGHALMLINPHTSFFFREELQMTSDEGLNAYGATTWGQFFIYQGFNEKAGWMHTSSGADVTDEYAETVTKSDTGYTWLHDGQQLPVTKRPITIAYKTPNGMKHRTITAYFTVHGPIVRQADGKWICFKMMYDPVTALTQSFIRTKSKGFDDFRKSMELHTNSSNNTIYADAAGNIAYFHANHVARRDATRDWQQPVDGTTSKTDWGTLWGVEESPFVHNPKNGWLYNTNNNPYSAAGTDSPKSSAFPKYMDVYDENPRGLHAARVLSARKDFTLETLRDAAYDSYQPAFAQLIPTLLKAYDATPANDPLKAELAEPVKALRGWDYRWSAESVPNTLAFFWGEAMWTKVQADPDGEDLSIYDRIDRKAPRDHLVAALGEVVDKLTADFGSWQVKWGDVNRFQRLTDDIVHPFADSGKSIPVPFVSARWGSLASFASQSYNGTKKIYGTSGNSFVAVVEFGDSVRARAVTAGGLNSVIGSKHFNDQAERYAAGDLREVYFYPSQLSGHVEKQYHPGAGKP